MPLLPLVRYLEQILLPLPRSATIWIGYSGGLDSTVLLHALARIDDVKGRLKAIHVHHGLSSYADDWARHCEQQCQVLGIPLIIEKITLTDTGDGIEQAARRARYEIFKQWAQPGDSVLLAHHANDQIETFFQRLFRGAGLTGLSAMPASRPLTEQVMLYRPLLDLTRQQLLEYAHELSWINDDSNEDQRFERNWWRQNLLPQIFARFPGKQTVLLRSLRQLQQDQQVLTELLSPFSEQCLRSVHWPATAAWALDLNVLAQQAAHLRPYLLRDWLRRLGYNVPSAQWLQTLEQEVIGADVDRQPTLALGSAIVRRHQQALYLTQVPDMPTVDSVHLSVDTQLLWARGIVFVSAGDSGLRSGDYQLVPAGTVRHLKIYPPQRPGKDLKAIFQEAGIPVWLRDIWPVLLGDGELAAVVGLQIAEVYAVSGAGALVVRWQ